MKFHPSQSHLLFNCSAISRGPNGHPITIAILRAPWFPSIVGMKLLEGWFNCSYGLIPFTFVKLYTFRMNLISLTIPHLLVPYIYIYLEPGVYSGYLIYWLAWALGSKYIGNWKMRETYSPIILWKLVINPMVQFVKHHLQQTWWGFPFHVFF